MSKKQAFAILSIFMLLITAMSLTLENSDTVASVRTVTSVLSFDKEAQVPKTKVARKVSSQGAVKTVEHLPFIMHEDMKHFQAKQAVLNNTQIVNQAKNAIENFDMRFEETK